MGQGLKEHRLEAIRSLREEYKKYDDTELVALCDKALNGDEQAYKEMLLVVTDTTMGGPSEEELAELHANLV